MNALIIVDPQVDFVTGSLAVAGAPESIHTLAESLRTAPVDHIFVTMDCHPIDHMSFDENGGSWPTHCIKYSTGAAIEPTLMDSLQHLPDSVELHFLEKGTRTDQEQYSAFENGYPTLLDEAEKIYICGIAGDVCVQNSIKDLTGHGLGGKLILLEDASPSLDDGTTLSRVISELHIKTSNTNNY